MTLAPPRPAATASVDSTPGDVVTRARSLWPRLDPRGLRRSNGDPERIARLVSRRSGLDRETIVAMLQRSEGSAAVEP